MLNKKANYIKDKAVEWQYNKCKEFIRRENQYENDSSDRVRKNCK